MPSADELRRMPRADRYELCLAYQQADHDPADPIAEDCTWSVATFGVIGRLRRAFAGNLEVWINQFGDEQAIADARYPQFQGRFPVPDEHVGPPRARYVSWWMEGRSAPMDPAATERMLGQVIREEAQAGRTPRPGERARWSRRFRKRHPGPKVDRLLTTLSHGRSSYVLRSGHEGEVVAWILDQPAASVTPDALFRVAYRAADGDLYRTLLTLENVLSRGFLDPDRQRRRLQAHLAPIIDTWDDRGDNFGAWYHLWGLTLYTYCRGAVLGGIAGSAESRGSHITAGPEHSEAQEDHINRLAVRLGRFLRRLVRRGDWRELPDDPEATSPDAYMSLDDFPMYRSWLGEPSPTRWTPRTRQHGSDGSP